MLRIITATSVLATLAFGCNHDSVRAEQQSERAELAREQSSEQRDLAQAPDTTRQEHAQLNREQQHERADQRQEQAEERHEERAEAREDLVDKTNQINNDREELSQEVRELNTLVGQACTGVSEPESKLCPLVADRIASVSNITDGVRINLTPIAGPRATIEQRVGCYRARAEIRQSTARLGVKRAIVTPAASPMCLLDRPGLELEVIEADGHVAVQLTTENPSHVRELRSQARSMVPASGLQASNNRRVYAVDANAPR